ncbi:unnamed protein product [Somion occarium]|uniref:F-box domain-containing protein n=1 Tax=Somion occarium TaxID=3059160 RepID=A0ABP1D4Y5_9APHY
MSLQLHASHPILIPELLALIFSHLDERNIARTATVCRQWAEISLDAAWRNVSDIRRLVVLLCPVSSQMQYGPRNSCVCTYKLKRSIHPSDWQRFDRYAYRVRSLTCDDKNRKHTDSSVWAEVKRTRSRTDLLPNLQSLSWYSCSADRQASCLHFLHAGVKRLSINVFPIQIGDSWGSFVEHVHAQAPGVTHLDIRSEFPVATVEVPIYCLTSTIAARFSTFEQLSVIAFSKPVERRTGQPSDVAHFAPSLSAGAFPALQKLSFSAHLAHALEFVNSPFAPHQLTSLYVNVIAIDNSFVLQHFFSGIATHFRQLRELRVDFIIGPDAPIVYPPPPLHTRPNIQTFRPLLSCLHLTKLEFRWDYQVNFTQADIEEIASSWPTLEVFLLNCQPIPEISGPVLTMHALLPFAQHCPRIRELGLYLNADIIPMHYPTSPLHTFKSLHTLSLGASTITNPNSVALSLSRLLPLGCEIVSGVRWPDAFGIALDRVGIMDDRRVRMTEWWVKWNEVAKVIPLAIEARMEERERITVLESEVGAATERLKVRE